MLVALTASLVLRMIKLVKTLIEGEYDKAYIMCAIACGASKMTIADPTNTMPKVIFPSSRMRENSQRPKSSVPNGYSALLDRYLPRIFVAVGSWGAKNDPNKKNSNITIGIEYERICFVRLIVWPPLSQKRPVAKSAVIYPKGY